MNNGTEQQLLRVLYAIIRALPMMPGWPRTECREELEKLTAMLDAEHVQQQAAGLQQENLEQAGEETKH